MRNLRRDGLFVKALLIMSLLFVGMFLAACNQEEENPPILLSEQAIQYVYPEDNVLALKSVTFDNEEEENRFILEFGRYAKYITKEGIEATFKEMEENSSNHQRRIIAESADHVAYTEVQAVYSKDSTFLVFHFEPEVKCSFIQIVQGSRTVEISGLWECPELFVMDSSCIQDGAEGVLFREQTYDAEKQKWNKCMDQFAEDVPETVD